jgi:hypothetical protein
MDPINTKSCKNCFRPIAGLDHEGPHEREGLEVTLVGELRAPSIHRGALCFCSAACSAAHGRHERVAALYLGLLDGLPRNQPSDTIGEGSAGAP